MLFVDYLSMLSGDMSIVENPDLLILHRISKINLA